MLRTVAVGRLAGRRSTISRPTFGSRIVAQRWYAEKTKSTIINPTPLILPGSQSHTAHADATPGLRTTITPTLSAKPITDNEAQIPLEPQPHDAPPPPPPKKKRFRNFLITITLLTLLGYGGGVYYSLQNDNFRDFFTESVPFAEQIVLKIEEREFQRRFPNATPRPPPAPSAKVTIPKKSGATAQLADMDKDKTSSRNSGSHIVGTRYPPNTEGKKDEKTENPLPRHTDTSESTVISRNSPAEAKVVHTEETPKPQSVPDKINTTPVSVKKSATEPLEAAKEGKPANDTKSVKDSVKDAARDTKDAIVTKSKTTKQSVKDALPKVDVDTHEPVIQELAKIINTVISIAGDGGEKAKDKMHEVISSAKSELTSVNEKLKDMKNGADKDALKEQELEFTKVATGIVSRMDEQIAQVENKWRQEYEKERQTLSDNYNTKLKKELEQAEKVYEEKRHNELLDQAIKLRRQWTSELKERVEKERDGRLGKLEALSNSVSDLEKLTTSWTDVLDANLDTQKLHVALEAVRASITDPAQPRPFIKELSALKEVSNDNEVVKAAIASINPVAYQRGLASLSQIIDRFRRVSDEVRKASLLSDDAGVAGHASSWMLSKLLFKKRGLATGGDVESILTRTETYLEEGELENAAREMNQLSGWSKTLASDWLKEVRVVLEVQQAMEVIAAQARLASLRRES